MYIICVVKATFHEYKSDVPSKYNIAVLNMQRVRLFIFSSWTILTYAFLFGRLEVLGEVLHSSV